MRRLPLITNSELKSYRLCARLHHLRYDRGLRPVHEREVLRFGTAVHSGLEAHWRGTSHVGAVQCDDSYDLEKALAMLDGYALYWRDSGFTVIGVELEFRATLANPDTGAASKTYELGGKLDALVMDSEGNVWIVEHKTTSEDATPGSDYWKRLRLDPQISTYMVGARALGYEPRGVLYDVLVKPTLQPRSIPLVDDDGVKIVRDAQGLRVRTKDGKKWRETGDAAQGYVVETRPETPAEYGVRVRDAIAADPDRYYVRGTVVRLEDEEREASADAWTTAGLIRDSRRTGRHARNPDACVRFGSTCEFFGVCTGETSADDETRFRRSAVVHEELSNAVEEAAQ